MNWLIVASAPLFPRLQQLTNSYLFTNTSFRILLQIRGLYSSPSDPLLKFPKATSTSDSCVLAALTQLHRVSAKKATFPPKMLQPQYHWQQSELLLRFSQSLLPYMPNLNI